MKKLLLIGTLLVSSASPMLALPLKQYEQMVSDYQTALESKNDALALEILANIEAEANRDEKMTVWPYLASFGLNSQSIETAKAELVAQLENQLANKAVSSIVSEILANVDLQAETTVVNPLFNVSDNKEEIAKKDVRPFYKKKRYIVSGLAALAGTGALFVDWSGKSK